MTSSLTLDLQRIAPAERGTTWQHWMRQWFGGLTLAELPERQWRGGRMRGEQLGAGWLWQLDNPCMRVQREANRHDALASLLVVIAVDKGSVDIDHAGRHVRVEAGQMVWIDGRLPMDCFTPACTLQILHVPRERVERLHPGCIDLLGRSLDVRRDPGARLLRDAMGNIGAVLPQLTPDQRNCALDSVIELHGMVTGDPSRAEPVDPRVARAQRDLEVSATDPLMTPARLATQQGMSRRHLDALMVHATGKTVTAHLWALRLDTAARLLRDPALAGSTVTDIAFEAGFGDAAHFSRTFKHRFGSTPSQWRRGPA